MYMSIRNFRNAEKKRDYLKIVKGDKVIAEEKIDGSNFTIFNDNGTIRIYSRRRELGFDDKFSGMPQWCSENLDLLESSIQEGYALFGEVLGQAKIGYNKKVGKGVERFYAFDYGKFLGYSEDDAPLFEYLPRSIVEMKAKLIGVPVAPLVFEGEFTSEEDFLEKYVNDKPSLIDSEFKREGVVVKKDNGAKIKIVSDAFAESQGVKPKRQKERVVSPEELEFESYVTPARVEKFFIKLKEDEIFDYEEYEMKDLGKVFSNVGRLVEDVLQEEFPEGIDVNPVILQSIARAGIKKELGLK